ncbi:hypothetical protein EVAR_18261_1 [Eumeta japonica]|uniref:Uncharacterized protein n=1 Tax=Eumeta variegata TaxID=151549 RepID=A0A4C1UL67_EUMVA|nr:hypothetical protein EVAR_18261_1 [Eumeta japonica]
MVNKTSIDSTGETCLSHHFVQFDGLQWTHVALARCGLELQRPSSPMRYRRAIPAIRCALRGTERMVLVMPASLSVTFKAAALILLSTAISGNLPEDDFRIINKQGGRQIITTVVQYVYGVVRFVDVNGYRSRWSVNSG